MVKRQKELGVATAEDAEIAREFNTAWQDTRQVFSSVFREVGASVLPVLADMLGGVQGFVQFLRDNENFVEGVFLGLSGIMTSKLAPALLAALTNPIALAAALALAFGALYDDVQAFLSGNDSLIGQISEKYPVVGEIVKDVAEAFGNLKENFEGLIEAIKSGDILGFTTGSANRPEQIESKGGTYSQSDIPRSHTFCFQ